MAIYDYSNIPTTLAVGDIINFSSAGLKKVVLPIGQYKLEVWGAQGGNVEDTAIVGGLGGYATGELSLDETIDIFVTVGAQGTCAVASTPIAPSSWANGVKTVGVPSIGGGGYGFAASVRGNGISYGASGGGGTSIHIGSSSPYARVLVAGGGGGSSYMRHWRETGYGGAAGNDYSGGYGTSGSGSGHEAEGAYQFFGGQGDYSYGANFIQQNTSGPNVSGSFYYGGDYSLQHYISSIGDAAAGGGGGGWYGGASGVHNAGGGGGGNGYAYERYETYRFVPLQGLTDVGKTRIYSLLSPKYHLSYAEVLGGASSFPNTSGTTEETGHQGDGYAKITVLATTPRKKPHENWFVEPPASSISALIDQPATNLTCSLKNSNGNGIVIESIKFQGLDKEYQNLLKEYCVCSFFYLDTYNDFNIFHSNCRTVHYVKPNGRIRDSIGDLPEGTEILITKNNIPTIFKIAKHNYSALGQKKERLSTHSFPTLGLTCLIQINNLTQKTFSFSNSTFVLYDLVDELDMSLDEYPTELQNIIAYTYYHTSVSTSVGNWTNADYQTTKIFYPSTDELGYNASTSYSVNEQGTSFISPGGLYRHNTSGNLITRTIDTTSGTLVLIDRQNLELTTAGTEFTGDVAHCFCIPISTPVKLSSDGNYYELDI